MRSLPCGTPTALMRQPTDIYRAASSMVAAALLFALMGVMAKLASRMLPNAMIVFLRSAIGLIMLLPWLLRARAPSLRTRHLKQHLVRGLFGIGAMYCFFFALAQLGLAEALLLNYSLPLFIPIVERIWLGEPIARKIWLPLSIGLFGLILILKPGSAIFQPAALIGMLAAILAATAQVGIRGLTRTEPITSIVFYFGVVSTLVSLGPALIFWTTPAPALWGTLLVLGASATAGQLLMTQAYHYAPATQVGPFIYTSVLFAGIFDWLVFVRYPDGFTLLGALLVVAAGVVTLRTAKRATEAGLG